MSTTPARLRPLMLAAAVAVAFVPDAGLALPETSGSIGRWRDYALRSITPDFSWAARPSVFDVRPTPLGDVRASPSAVLPRLRFEGASGGPLDVGFARSLGVESPALANDGFSASLLEPVGPVLERTVIAPSLNRSLGDRASVTASLVLAQQRFASSYFGAGLDRGDAPLASRENSFGSGVRLEMRRQLDDAIGFTTAYQSKVNMNPFQHYRGVFSDPGDFDLPAVASAALAWNAGSVSALEFGVSRVMYSDIPAFTSRGLPPRLLQAIGDGDSPAFAWRDLTVYTVGWSWQATPSDRFGLRYSTQLQPEPTAAIYGRALEDSYTDNNVALSWQRRVGDRQVLRVGASYSSAPYYLGGASSFDWRPGGDQVEVEAVYSVAF